MGHIGSAATWAARDIHHTKQMQLILCMGYIPDHMFLMIESNNTNLRLWKARTFERVGQLSTREETALRYWMGLVQKYTHLSKVRWITRGRCCQS